MEEEGRRQKQIPDKARKTKGFFYRIRHGLHGRGFQSKRFPDLETASKTIRFQRVYTEPIQPLNRGYYMPARGYEFYLRVVKSISHE